MEVVPAGRRLKPPELLALVTTTLPFLRVKGPKPVVPVGVVAISETSPDGVPVADVTFTVAVNGVELPDVVPPAGLVMATVVAARLKVLQLVSK